LSYGTVEAMESEHGNADGTDAAGDGERRRRRRRRKKKKTKELSDTTRQLLLLARWGIGGLTMLAIWAYGVWVGSKLGWGALIFLPAGAVGMVCIAYALAVPFVTVLVVIVAFLLQVDAGLLAGLRRAGMAFLAVGALNAVWRAMVFSLHKREVTRDEAGYK